MTAEILRRAERHALAAVVESAIGRFIGGPAPERNDGILVAISGGADSSALLVLAAAVASRRGWRVEAATVDHHLRPESSEDADHAMRLATRLGIPGARLDIRPGGGPGLPARARRLRYGALETHASARSCGILLTAHHADDQLETMLLALARGAGPNGLAGMRRSRRLASGIRLVRPLLEVERGRLVAFLRGVGVEWREDPTNDSPVSPRGRVRHRIVPELAQLRNGVSRRAARGAALLREADRFMTRCSAAHAATLRSRLRSSTAGDGAVESVMLRRDVLKVPRALRARALRRVLRDLGVRVGIADLVPLASAIGDGGTRSRRFHLSDACTARVGARTVRLVIRGSARTPDPPRTPRRRSAPRRRAADEGTRAAPPAA